MASIQTIWDSISFKKKKPQGYDMLEGLKPLGPDTSGPVDYYFRKDPGDAHTHLFSYNTQTHDLREISVNQLPDYMLRIRNERRHAEAYQYAAQVKRQQSLAQAPAPAMGD